MYTNQKITKIEGFALSSEYGDGKVFGQPKGKKSIGFIEVTSESGAKGFGEAYCGIYSPELIKPIVKFLSNYIIGKTLDDLSFFDEIDMIPFIGYTGILQGVRVGAELAVMDLIGKIEEKPVHELFPYQEKKKEIKCYYSGGSVVFTPDLIKQDIEDLSKMGFGAYKMRVGHQTWGQDIHRVETAAKLLKNKNLMVDAIMGTLKKKWTLMDAELKIKDLLNYNIFWIEEPLCPTSISDYEKLRKKSKIPIALGEAYSGKINFESIISNNAADIIQFDATNSMGLRKLIDFSIKNKIKQATHVWGTSLSLIANANLSLLSKNINYLEYPSVKFKISDDIVEEKIKIINGKYIPNTYPGFGIKITDAIKERYSLTKNSGYRI
tara:strand:- start:2047 stop:3186 length:1140 start_codon:yes stop_codon:yes gene_type:complete